MTWHDDEKNYRAAKAGRTSAGAQLRTQRTSVRLHKEAVIAFKKWPGYPYVKLKKGLTHHGVLFTPQGI